MEEARGEATRRTRLMSSTSMERAEERERGQVTCAATRPIVPEANESGSPSKSGVIA